MVWLNGFRAPFFFYNRKKYKRKKQRKVRKEFEHIK
jgi:hypothetical protein